MTLGELMEAITRVKEIRNKIERNEDWLAELFSQRRYDQNERLKAELEALINTEVGEKP